MSTAKNVPQAMNHEHLRLRIAETMGWKLAQRQSYWAANEVRWTHPSTTSLPVSIPDYTTDANAAHQLVEHMRKEGWLPSWKGYASGIEVFTFSKYDDEYEGRAPTFPLAVSLAFAKAKGINPTPETTQS